MEGRAQPSFERRTNEAITWKMEAESGIEPLYEDLQSSA